MASAHGARNVRVFGSRARGEGGEQSDIDILVNLERGRTLLDLVRLKRELEELTSRDVDVVTDEGLSPILRETILSQAVAL
ncbi:MAG TPA: nucleotidyltransferase family protein [Thermoanaerobaculia bacterium]|nr:nucleotidyltransferase family protein [Thermoanaerobaculia bacterium]